MTKNSNDENGSHVKETVLMINTAIARIEHAMIEGDESSTSLSQAFANITNSAQAITLEVQKLDDSPIKNNINESCTSISSQVDNSIVAFQFYDLLSQRMALASKILSSLTDMLSDPSKTHTQDQWTNLQETIRSKYTLDADQELFDAVLSGASIQDAIKVAAKKTEDGEIEFF